MPPKSKQNKGGSVQASKNGHVGHASTTRTHGKGVGFDEESNRIYTPDGGVWYPSIPPAVAPSTPYAGEPRFDMPQYPSYGGYHYPLPAVNGYGYPGCDYPVDGFHGGRFTRTPASDLNYFHPQGAGYADPGHFMHAAEPHPPPFSKEDIIAEVLSEIAAMPARKQEPPVVTPVEEVDIVDVPAAAKPCEVCPEHEETIRTLRTNMTKYEQAEKKSQEILRESKTLTETNTKIRGQLKKVERECKALQDRLQQKDEGFRRETTARLQADSHLQAAQQKIRQLEEEVRGLKSRADNHAEKAKNHEARVKRLETLLQRVRGEKELMTSVISTLTAEKESLQKRCTIQEKDAAVKKQTSVKGACKICGKKEQQILASRKRAGKMKNDLDEMQKIVKSQKSALARAEDERDTMRKLNDELITVGVKTKKRLIVMATAMGVNVKCQTKRDIADFQNMVIRATAKAAEEVVDDLTVSSQDVSDMRGHAMKAVVQAVLEKTESVGVLDASDEPTSPVVKSAGPQTGSEPASARTGSKEVSLASTVAAPFVSMTSLLLRDALERIGKVSAEEVLGIRPPDGWLESDVGVEVVGSLGLLIRKLGKLLALGPFDDDSSVPIVVTPEMIDMELFESQLKRFPSQKQPFIASLTVGPFINKHSDLKSVFASFVEFFGAYFLTEHIADRQLLPDSMNEFFRAALFIYAWFTKQLPEDMPDVQVRKTLSLGLFFSQALAHNASNAIGQECDALRGQAMWIVRKIPFVFQQCQVANTMQRAIQVCIVRELCKSTYEHTIPLQKLKHLHTLVKRVFDGTEHQSLGQEFVYASCFAASKDEYAEYP